MAANFKSQNGRILQTEAVDLLDTITVVVGSEALKYTVHEAIIRKSSKFFDNPMKPEWTTSRPEPRMIDFTDEDSATFEIYLHWLYSKALPAVSRQSSKENAVAYEELSKCYILGEKLIDENFKNAVLDAFRDANHHQPFSRFARPGSESLLESFTMARPKDRRLGA